MSRHWTHPICKVCWDETHPDRQPARITDREIEHCCYCGRHTSSGIYIRADADGVVGHDGHERGVQDR